MRVGHKVKLITFNGTKRPSEEVHESENYWKLIGKTGTVQQYPNEDSLYASFSREPRILVEFDEDLKSQGLVSHNKIKNSLWILVNDLEVV